MATLKSETDVEKFRFVGSKWHGHEIYASSRSGLVARGPEVNHSEGCTL